MNGAPFHVERPTNDAFVPIEVISMASWSITSPDLTQPILACWPHMTEIRVQYPEVEVRFLLDCFDHPKGCDACVAVGRPVTTRNSYAPHARKSCTKTGDVRSAA